MKKYQFCCDMDGVLCDFASGAVKIVNHTLKRKDRFKLVDKETYNLIERAIEEIGKDQATYHDIRIGTPHKNLRTLMKNLCRNNEDFWANLEWMEGGQEIWNAIKNHDPYILSAPMGKSKESKAGKIRWVQKNLGIPVDNIILDDDKYHYTKFGNRTGVLIDDMDFNINPYRKHGGVAIHHTNLDNTKKLIKKYTK